MIQKYIKKSFVALVAATIVPVVVQSTALAYESPLHVFSINDVMGGFDGSTYGSLDGASIDPTIICGLGVPCPPDNGPITDKAGVTLYPVDSEFGYYVVDYLGAEGKIRDFDYMEGFVGNIMDGLDQIGIKIANAPTLKYKVKPPLGTWCQGLAAPRLNARPNNTSPWSMCSVAMRPSLIPSLTRSPENRPSCQHPMAV